MVNAGYLLPWGQCGGVERAGSHPSLTCYQARWHQAVSHHVEQGWYLLTWAAVMIKKNNLYKVPNQMPLTQGTFNRCYPPISPPFLLPLSPNCWNLLWLLFHLVKITWKAWPWYIQTPLTSTEPPTEILMVTDPEAESASTAFALPSKGQVFSGDCTTLMKKTARNKQYGENISHAVSIIRKLL